MTKTYLNGLLESYDAVDSLKTIALADPYVSLIKTKINKLIAAHLHLEEEVIAKLIILNRDLLIQLDNNPVI